jgi:hypothetical protein
MYVRQTDHETGLLPLSQQIQCKPQTAQIPQIRNQNLYCKPVEACFLAGILVEVRFGPFVLRVSRSGFVCFFSCSNLQNLRNLRFRSLSFGYGPRPRCEIGAICGSYSFSFVSGQCNTA